MASGNRTAIPMTLLRHYRTVLSKKRSWARATGGSRIEALDRVREMGAR